MSINKKMIIKGPRIFLRKLEMSDVNKQYLGWMNDAGTQAYTRRRGLTTTMAELKKFIRESRTSNALHLAIVNAADRRHIGNIFLQSIDYKNKSAEISIMIGNNTDRGKGYAAEAIALICALAFKKLGLHRLSAASPNPAFNAMLKKSKWTLEGTKRESFYYRGKFIDVLCWSILKKEYEKK